MTMVRRARAKRSAFPLRVACIDIGSNGIRCAAALFTDADQHQMILQERAAVRLGQGVFQTGAIDRESMDAAILALASFKKGLDVLGVKHLRVVATSAVREAANQDQLLLRARREAKVAIEVIHGVEEARLGHVAVAHRIPMGRDPWMLMDLGGGSVEVSLADARGIRWSESYPMGAVRLLAEFASCKGDTKRFQAFVADTMAPLRSAGAKGHAPVGLAATGGNIEALADLADAKPDGKGVRVVPVETLRALAQKLAGLSVEERQATFGLRPDRADVIVPAALIYEQVAKLVGLDAIHVPFTGLKDGVLHDLVDGLALRATGARDARIA